MLVFTGKYRFFKRTVAYRSDYCLFCEAPTVSERMRTFDVFHVYWVPLLPLGFRKHWHCTRCRENPHERMRTSKAIKVLGVLAFSCIALISWLMPIEQPGDVSLVWGMRIGSSCLVVLFVLLVLFHKPGPRLKDELRSMPRFVPRCCLACGEELDDDARQCAQCHVEYL